MVHLQGRLRRGFVIHGTGCGGHLPVDDLKNAVPPELMDTKIETRTLAPHVYRQDLLRCP